MDGITVPVNSLSTAPIDWSAFIPTERAVIVFVRRDEEILLIHKKRGLGAGKINGPGGRLETDETPEQAAVRETHEEVGLHVHDLAMRAHLRFAFADGYQLEVFVFVTKAFDGTLTETDEALPFWCPVHEIPYAKMWADDRLWLPRVLSGENVCGKFTFTGDVMTYSSVETRD